MLQAEEVTKKFGRVDALNSVTLTVRRGQVVVLIGPSGCGKSTFLRCINHLEEYDSGRILVDGSLVGYHEEHGRLVTDGDETVAFQRRKIGMVFQRFNLFPHLTALENVCEGPIHVLKIDRKTARHKSMELLTRVGLSERAHFRPYQLSGGQQQRVAIARALAMNPLLLLFDEPTSALDPEMTQEVLLVIRDIARDGATMILVTHEMEFARAVADRVVIMDDGRVIESGTPDEVLQASKEQRTRTFLQKLAIPGPPPHD